MRTNLTYSAALALCGFQKFLWFGSFQISQCLTRSRKLSANARTKRSQACRASSPQSGAQPTAN